MGSSVVLFFPLLLLTAPVWLLIALFGGYTQSGHAPAEFFQSLPELLPLWWESLKNLFTGIF